MSEAYQPLIGFGTRVRRSPFFEATMRWGCKAYTVYNHMYMPSYFSDPVSDYWDVVRTVSLWDVACERQVEISGPDAQRFTQLLTPRDLSGCGIGKCRYALITDDDGFILNDPLLLRLEENRYWLSISDSDLLLRVKGVAWRSGLRVTLDEPDASPLAVQGPKSLETLIPVFGDWLAGLKYYNCVSLEWQGVPLVISRSGWSAERGYEIYLCDGAQGDKLWDAVMEAGKPHGIKPGAPNQIRRMEAGMLSYGTDVTRHDTPFHVGLEKFVDLDIDAEVIGLEALRRVAAQGVDRQLAGIEFAGDPIEKLMGDEWPVMEQGRAVGKVTTSVYSPRLEKNIALVMVPQHLSVLGSRFDLLTPKGPIEATVVPVPFYDPNKKLARSD